MMAGCDLENQEVHYTRAPIAEAVLDIQVSTPAPITLQLLLQLASSESQLYPVGRSLLTVEGHVSAGEQVSASASQQHIGYVFATQDSHQIVQVRQNGFTFSQVTGYDTWAAFRDEAQRLWKQFRSAMNGIVVNRIALRYVNRINLPGQKVEIKDYLRTFPELAPELPQMFSGYFMQVQVPLELVGAKLILNQALDPSAYSDTISVLLDIDVFIDNDLPDDDNSLWARFEQLRHEKNKIFESCITDEVRGLIR